MVFTPCSKLLIKIKINISKKKNSEYVLITVCDFSNTFTAITKEPFRKFVGCGAALTVLAVLPGVLSS